MNRIWSLKMNLDQFNSVYALAFTEQDKAQMLTGIFVGCNGGDVPEDSSRSLRAGFEMGTEWREEAVVFLARKSEGGRISADRRKKKYGTAQPAKTEQNSNILRDDLELIPNQTTNHKPQTTETTIQQPKKKRRSIREKLDLLEGYHPSAELVVRELIPVWPTEAGERTIKSDPYLAAARLTEIFSEYPTLDPQLLIGAALRYRNNLQEANELQYLSGLQFFFGPGKAGKTPKWKDEVRALRHEQKLENA